MYHLGEGNILNKAKVDTTNILFICGGAFAGLDKVINKEVKARLWDLVQTQRY